MPVLSPEQLSQFLERRGTMGHALLWVTARNRQTNLPESIGFWTGDDHQEFLIGGEIRTYFGSGSFIDVPLISAGVGFTIRQHRFKLAPFADEVRQLIRGYEPRRAKVELHAQPFDINSGNLLGAPIRMLKGYLDTAPEDLGPKNSDSVQEVVVVSSARDLTTALPLMRSNEELQKRAPNDRFREYSDIAGEVSIPWGQNG
ncbi:hypothetical protein K3727_09440 [Rhodobacteraceae bacterium M382]|nr:hypothetical protein K3727_09440 [Rhodobacteraceae bacterium M382]